MRPLDIDNIVGRYLTDYDWEQPLDVPMDDSLRIRLEPLLDDQESDSNDTADFYGRLDRLNPIAGDTRSTLFTPCKYPTRAF
jgi:hypothetical protein